MTMKSNRRVDAAQGEKYKYGARGPNGHGYYDYKENKFIMSDGR